MNDKINDLTLNIRQILERSKQNRNSNVNSNKQDTTTINNKYNGQPKEISLDL